MATMTAAIRTIIAAVAALGSDKRGATAVEYSILIVMIMVALTGMVAVGGVADGFGDTFNSIATQLKQ